MRRYAVFVDIDPRTFNLEPRLVESAVSPKTRAILCVHQMGMPCDLGALDDIALRHGLRLVEDAACAIGSEILWNGHWERIGRPHGDLACFSFHPRKILTTGDGGMITTSNAEWDCQLRQWRHHGMNSPAHARHTSDQVIWESYEELGYNYRMTDIQGAIGREQLRRLPEMVARRRELGDRYAERLVDVPGITPPPEPDWARSNWQSYCVRLADGVDQRTVMQRLLDDGIATRRGVMCAHREPPAYPAASWRCESAGLRHSEEAQDRSIILPLFPQMTEEDQQFVIQALQRACAA